MAGAVAAGLVSVRRVEGHDAALWSAEQSGRGDRRARQSRSSSIAGEAAILVAMFRGLSRAASSSALIVAVAFLSQYLPWAVNPKGLEFSYYFFPSRDLPRPGARAGVLPRARCVAARRGALRFSRWRRSASRSSCRSSPPASASVPTAFAARDVAAVMALSRALAIARANRAMARRDHERARFALQRPKSLPPIGRRDPAFRARRRRVFPRRLRDLRAALLRAAAAAGVRARISPHPRGREPLAVGRDPRHGARADRRRLGVRRLRAASA